MAVAEKQQAGPRWSRRFDDQVRFSDDLGVLGAWVGPRTGRDRRTQGQKEDYVLRRLLVAWKAAKRLSFPFGITAASEEPGAPDFVMTFGGDMKLGIEVTEAGEESYQEWLTWHSRKSEMEAAESIVPLPVSTDRTAAELSRAIEGKVRSYDSGKYRELGDCDLVVYDNTAYAALLDVRELVKALGRPNHLLGRFRQVHIVFESAVLLDVFGEMPQRVEIGTLYEIDFARWIFDQVERLREDAAGALDTTHILEELEGLGISERRALGSHLRNLLLHLLKWQHQHAARSGSWMHSINNARAEIDGLLEDSPSLHAVLLEKLPKSYDQARQLAAKETNLDISTFPDECPFEIEALLDVDFLPG